MKTLGAKTVQGFSRLYLLPGMGHCRGGQAPAELDLLTPMLAWVDAGQAPGAVLTSTTAEVSGSGQPEGARTRAMA